MRFVFLVLLFGAVACTSAKKDWRYIAIPDQLNRDGKIILSEEKVRADLDQLEYAVTSTYSGRKFLPGTEFTDLIAYLRTIKGEMSVDELCKRIDTGFDRVSDAHLTARFNRKPCAVDVVQRKGRVGKNFFPRGDIPWKVESVRKKNKNALLISITSFPKYTSPAWDGFLQTVRHELSHKDLVILDLRANGGGDDGRGYDLATLLAGTKLEKPYGPQWTGSNPEVYQVFVNSFEYWMRRDREEGKEPPKYLVDLKNEFVTKRDKAERGEPVTLIDDLTAGATAKEGPFVLEKSVKVPIYILMDADCGSSCESTTHYFEYNPLVKRVGENTAGYVHFGNNGNVFLNNSGIVLQFAVSYNNFKDGRFIEKKGIDPQIPVAPGTDAMDVAWKDFLTTKRK